MASGATRLDIYNMALGFIGTRTVGSPNEQTPEAIQCNLMWDRARRSALRDYPWTFALRRIKLAEKEVPDEFAMDWAYCYGTASDNLKVIRVFVGNAIDNTNGQSGYSTTLGYRTAICDGVEVILTEQEEAYCEYIADVENISLWDELFVMAIARKLACLIAVPLLKNSNELKILDQLYQQVIPSAESQSATEKRVRKHVIDEWALPHWDGGWNGFNN